MKKGKVITLRPKRKPALAQLFVAIAALVMVAAAHSALGPDPVSRVGIGAGQ